jgi:hypothetical protein
MAEVRFPFIPRATGPEPFRDEDPDPGAGTISHFRALVKDLQRDAVQAVARPEWQASLDNGVPHYDAIAP